MQPVRPTYWRSHSFRALLVGAWFLTFATLANAALFIVDTPPGSNTGGQPVSARATITTGVDQVIVQLENLQADPTSVTQCLSGFQFHIDSGQTSGSLASSTGQERTVNANGTFVNGANAATGWGLSTVGSDLKLNLLGQPAAPDHTIIGPPAGSNIYEDANPSITNGIHSPFLGLSATFTLNVPGVTAASTVSGQIFQFNTSPGFTVAVPEPASAAAVGAIVLGMLSARRQSIRR